MLAGVLFFSIYALPVLSIDISFDPEVTVDIGETQVVHHVTVGEQNNPAFTPDQLNANIGDHIIFEFSSVNHTLTQSSLDEPCSSIGQFDTGFRQFNPQNKDDLTVTLTVNSLEPQWFFCEQEQLFSHCHAGMVFAINPGNKMRTFLDNAKRDTGTGSAMAPASSVGPAFNSTSISALHSFNPTSHSASRTASHSAFHSAFHSASRTVSRSASHSASRSASRSIVNPSSVFVAPSSPSGTLPNFRSSQTSKPVGIPASASAVPSTTSHIVIKPVTVVTITKTLSCTGTGQPKSVRRSISPPDFTSDGSESAVAFLGTTLLCSFITVVVTL